MPLRRKVKGTRRSHITCGFNWLAKEDNPPHIMHVCKLALLHSGLHKCKCGRKHGN